MNKSLSGKEILDNSEKTRVMKYKDLADYDDIMDVFGSDDNLVLLYETRDNYGHWACVLKYPDRFLVFDSYGVSIDDELNSIPEYFKKHNGMDYPHLSWLLYNSPEKYRIEYNEYPYQRKGKDINTCGRWVLARIWNRHLSNDEFARRIQKIEGDLDEFIVELTD